MSPAESISWKRQAGEHSGACILNRRWISARDIRLHRYMHREREIRQDLIFNAGGTAGFEW